MHAENKIISGDFYYEEINNNIKVDALEDYYVLMCSWMTELKIKRRKSAFLLVLYFLYTLFHVFQEIKFRKEIGLHPQFEKT